MVCVSTTCVHRVDAAPLRVAAFNVEVGLGALGTSNAEAAARHFERIGADVLALEELMSDYANLAALQQRLGLPYSDRPTESSMQVGLLSRYPLLSKFRIYQAGMTRPILLAQIDVPGLATDPWIAVVHLKCCGSTGGSEQFTRAKELYYLRQALVTRGITPQDNVILLGDFNLVATGDYTYPSGPDGISPFFAPASADGYFSDLGLLKLDLRHADGLADWSWRSEGIFPSSQLDHIMASGPIRSANPRSEIYDVVKDAAGLVGRSKFGDQASPGSPYGSDHLPVFADVVLRDAGDGFAADSSAPSLALQGSAVILNSPGGSFRPAITDLVATDDQDPAPVLTCYPLLNSFSTTGDKTITYMGRDRMGNTATLDRTVRVIGAGAVGFSANLQWPRHLVLDSKAGQIYARIFVQGMSEGTDTAPDIRAWIGISGENTPPSSWPESAWRAARLNPYANDGSDEYMIDVQSSDFSAGNYHYASRWRIGNGSYLYGGMAQANPNGGGGLWDGVTFTSGLMTVTSSFAQWSGGVAVDPQTVARYAIGGASSMAAEDSVAPISALTDASVSIVAIVRTNDPFLTTTGCAATDLAAGTWSTNDVTMSPAADQTTAPAGCQIQVFTTPRSSGESKFLRLQSTLSSQ